MAMRIPKSVRNGQFKAWIVCQLCGRTVAANDSTGWLNQPHRLKIGVRVVRCPQHISEWALRHTREGRTKENRALMSEGKTLPEPPIPPYSSPFPLADE